MTRAAVRLEGQGLHTAAHGAVTFARGEGPVRIVQGDRSETVDRFVVVDATRSTTIATASGAMRIGTVEHLLAALAGASCRLGVVVTVEGPEIPLADGGAAAFMDALFELGVASVPAMEAPSLVIARAGIIEVGASRYELEPGTEVSLEVEVDFGDERLARRAAWDGSVTSFRERIAIARTFGFEAEVMALAAQGLASHVSRESVVVVAERNILSAGREFEADEPARHKLLDLAGDLYLHGGPPRGRIRALRPGHAATHEAVGRALSLGLLARAS